MCGGRATSADQFGQSEIVFQSDPTGNARNELKRPREMNASSKPPVAPKRHQVEPPSNPNCTTVVTGGAAGINCNSASTSKAPPGVFDFPMPKNRAVFDMRQFYDVFFSSPVDHGSSLISKPIVVEGFWPFDDEIMDDDMERIWLPILHQPLIPIVFKQRCSRFF